MRLLQSQNSCDFSLTDDLPDDKLPPYAILSHTWREDDEEVHFADLQGGCYKTKVAYAKLQFCAKRARQDEISHFWIDTCCINRSNNAELSEAIASMYRWYHEAQKCYVFLSDVSSGKTCINDGREKVWLSSFRRSRWFTRGWTLQELLAPSIVEFYSKEGDPLGSKISLAQLVHEITTIPLKALQGTSLSEFPIEERLRWTEKRETKKPEDKAYCLIGIFDVSIPLLYGERKHAPDRLRRAINEKYGMNAGTIGQESDQEPKVIDVANWYSSTDFAAQQTDQLARRRTGTGNWFLNHSKYRDWRQQANSTLLCPGIPGAGKSVMAATVIDDLQTSFEAGGDIGIAYFYCNFNRQAEQGLNSLLSILIRQLFQERACVPQAAKALYQRHRDRATRPSVEELKGVLQLVINSHNQVFVVIDALDECGDNENQLTDLLNELFLSQRCGTGRLNLLTTTRYIPEITQQFLGNPQLEIRANADDISLYLADRMSTLAPAIRRNVDLQVNIKRRIIDAADGMFLLARLQFDSLCDKTNPGKMKLALAQLKKGSDALNNEYDKAIDRIECQSSGLCDLAKRALLWIIYATYEISIDELREAVAIDHTRDNSDLDDFLDDEEQIVSVCQGMVVVDQETRIIHLVHYTTQEYFERIRDQWLPNGNLTIAQSCIAYLEMDVFDHKSCEWGMDLTDVVRRHKLLEYAGENWGVHARSVQNNALRDCVVRILSDPDHVRLLAMVLLVEWRYDRHHSRYLQHVSAIHIVARFGGPLDVLDLIRANNDINGVDSNGRTPLHYAIRGRHKEVIKWLLAQPDIDVNLVDIDRKSAFCWAIDEGYRDAIELLFTHPRIEINGLGGTYYTPLLTAVRKGDTDSIRLLLTHPNIDVNHFYDSTPFLVAAIMWTSLIKNPEMINLLLAQPDIDVNIVDNEGETPLHRASLMGYTETIRSLLAHPSIDVNIMNHQGETPLHKAIWTGDTEVGRLLLAHPSIDVNIMDKHGMTPLHITVFEDRTEKVQLLVAHPSIDVNITDHQRKTPLHKAASRRYTEVVRLLLAHPGIDVNVVDNEGSTPLHEAAFWGATEAIRLLLAQPKIEVNPLDYNGETPLCVAKDYGHEDIVQLLLAAGAKREELDDRPFRDRACLGSEGDLTDT